MRIFNVFNTLKGVDYKYPLIFFIYFDTTWLPVMPLETHFNKFTFMDTN